MNSDSLSDMLTRIKNAALVHKATITVPYTNLCAAVAQVIHHANYLESVSESGDGTGRVLVLKLQYVKGISAISDLRRISKPGVRIYRAHRDFRPVLSGLGLAIVSTSAGVMSGQEAKKKGLGGEVLAELW